MQNNRHYLSEAQERHLREMWAKRPDNWQNREGAPKKLDIVREYRKDYPYATRYACARDTGLSYNTVNKWWEKAGESRVVL